MSIEQQFKARDYKSDLKPIWCPGCGDFGVVSSIYKALAAIGRPPHEIAFFSGIGCSSRIPGYATTYGFNSVHGRGLTLAQGLKMVSPELLVLVASGDGDGFSIGGGHLPHAVRRNMDITYIVMDNMIYGLTKGQVSPTSRQGLKTVSTSYGSLEQPMNPLSYMLSYGAGFVAQSTPADLKGLADLTEQAIRYPGFSFLNVQSPCVTYGEGPNFVRGQRERMKQLSELGHDPSDRVKAFEYAEQYTTELHLGVFYENPNPPPTYNDLVKERQDSMAGTGLPKDKILDKFVPAS